MKRPFPSDTWTFEDSAARVQLSTNRTWNKLENLETNLQKLDLGHNGHWRLGRERRKNQATKVDELSVTQLKNHQYLAQIEYIQKKKKPKGKLDRNFKQKTQMPNKHIKTCNSEKYKLNSQ